MNLRHLHAEELPQALSLVREVFQRYQSQEYTQEGMDEFHSFLKDASQLQALIFYGAFDQQQLVGVLAMRSQHISLLFVQDGHHRKGIAKALFQYMLSSTGYQDISVNSSPYAIHAYEHLGFQLEGEERCVNGIRFTPMHWTSH